MYYPALVCTAVPSYIDVQEEIKRRAETYYYPTKNRGQYPFSGIIVCAGCGKHYRRKNTAGGPVWICPTFNSKGKSFCPSKQIPENTLISITKEVLGSLEAFPGEITEIRAENDNKLVFCFRDGSQTIKRWQDRSRRNSWTPEMKETARRRELERRANYGG